MTKDNVKMNQFQIGKDMRVGLQIPPSLNQHFKASEKNLRLGGTDHNGDYGQARMLQSHGYNSTMIQVGTSSGRKVNFYNGTGTITSMNFNSFIKLGK